MPAGLEVTVPLPVPFLPTLSVNCWTLKLAVTEAAAFIVTLHAPVPEQAPLQPVNVEPPVGVAVRLTTVPLLYGSEQSAPQLMPAGLEVTVPLPAPVLLTVSGNVCGAWRLKFAVTVVAAFIVTLQPPVPEQPPPLQPVNVDPPAGVAVRLTTVPPS